MVREKLTEAAGRFVLTLLLATGLTMPLLGVFGLLGSGLPAFGLVLLCSLTLSAASMNRWALMGTWAVLALGFGLWGVQGGGLVVQEVARGMMLHLNGFETVMPLLAGQAAAVLAVFVSLCAFGLTSRHSGALPAVMVTALALVLLWLRGEPALVAWLLPALCAALLMSAQFVHADVDFWHLLPWAGAMACAACLLVPNGGVTVEPMRAFATQLREKIEDYLFFGNHVRTSFSLITEGYYTQGLTQMGGPAWPTDHPVMTVQTPRQVYLKGVSMNQYTGRMWQNTVRGKQYLWVSPLHRQERARAFDSLLPRGALAESNLMESSQVTVTMQTTGTTSLFVPQRVREVSTGGDLVAYFNDSGEVFVNRDLEMGDSYTVTAPLFVGGDAGVETLVSASASEETRAAYEAVAAVYTLLPEHLQSQVYEKTWEAVGSAQTPYQKALTIRNWLRANYHYRLDVPPQDTNMDFVYRFLLGYEREGYCMHFASAMTVMCRIVGLPARYVEGYLAEPNANGVAHVTGLQAHAWTEVYFEGFGWLVFDPTPPRHNMTQNPGDGSSQDDNQDEPTPSPTATPEPIPTPEPDDMSGEPSPEPTPEAPSSDDAPTSDPDTPPDTPPEDNRRGPNLWWLWLLLALLLAAAARIVWTLPENMAKRARDETARWLVWSQALHDALHVMRRPKRTGESPMAYLRRLAMRGLHPELLDDAGELEALVFYGRHVPDAEDAAMVREAYQALWNDLGGWKKGKLLLLRAFVPGKRRDFRSA